MISDAFSRRITASMIIVRSRQIIHPVRNPCRPSALDTDPVVMPRWYIPAIEGARGPCHSNPA